MPYCHYAFLRFLRLHAAIALRHIELRRADTPLRRHTSQPLIDYATLLPMAAAAAFMLMPLRLADGYAER